MRGPWPGWRGHSHNIIFCNIVLHRCQNCQTLEDDTLLSYRSPSCLFNTFLSFYCLYTSVVFQRGEGYLEYVRRDDEDLCISAAAAPPPHTSRLTRPRRKYFSITVNKRQKAEKTIIILPRQLAAVNYPYEDNSSPAPSLSAAHRHFSFPFHPRGMNKHNHVERRDSCKIIVDISTSLFWRFHKKPAAH